MKRSHRYACVLTLLFPAASAFGAFHRMQIEQVVGGVNGDTSAQAIQLRMNSGGQLMVSQARLYVHDASGSDRILLLDFPFDVVNASLGDRVLIVTPTFISRTDPPTVPDFNMLPIPPAYLAAGSLTFEDDFGTVFWRFSWGGTAYTGSGAGDLVNDADGNYNPPFAGPIPSAALEAVRFTGPANALSSHNAGDYAAVGLAPAFTNNARATFTLTGTSTSGACCNDASGLCSENVLQTSCNGATQRYGGDGSICGSLHPSCQPAVAVALPVVAGGLVSPTNITHAGDGSGRLFVTDQVGVIHVVSPGSAAGEIGPFLDISDRMITPDPGFDERGLLGVAFHPDYETNGRFFVRYSAPRAGAPGEPCFGTSRGCSFERLSEFLVTGSPDVADPDSEIILLEIVDPQFNHNGGEVAFGPDGMLYLSMGDGGGANDGLSSDPPLHGPIGNGQSLDTLLGKVLRIDVDAAPDLGLNYHVPADNPFVAAAGLDEIWAYGFRNPFSFAFDDGPGGSGALYLGDVGQELFEELNIVASAGNYGWVIREGFHCFDPMNPTVPPASCPTTGTVLGDPLIDPVLEYLQPVSCNDDADCAPLGVGCGNNGLCLNEGGISIIVAGVYRGSEFAALSGKLVFGDFAQNFGTPTGRLYYTDLTGPEAFERRQFFLWPNNAPLGRFVKGMGVGEDGEIYIGVSQVLAPTGTTGQVLRIAQPLPAVAGASPRYLQIQVPNSPAPFALLVTPACLGGTPRYVGPPSGSENIAFLVDNPAQAAFRNSLEWGAFLRVTGADIVPDADYQVQMDTGTPGSPDLSEVTVATTRRWGDVVGPFVAGAWTPPDGSVDVTTDVLAILERFRNTATAAPFYQTDLVGQTPTGIGCQPDRGVAIVDVTQGLQAFRSVPYGTSTRCQEPCP